MPPRFFVDQALRSGETVALPPGPARHVQVLRLQPGAALTLFDGRGGEAAASVVRIGRSQVEVAIGALAAVDRELPFAVTLALGMPANDRMDALVEKATELGVAAIQPLLCERSVLRLAGERAQKKVAHWQAVAVAACEQSGRTRVPRVAAVLVLPQWLKALADAGSSRWLLGFEGARPLRSMTMAPSGVVCLSGPEGGFAPTEEAAARDAGFEAVSLGARVLRADTAPLALLAWLAAAAA